MLWLTCRWSEAAEPHAVRFWSPSWPSLVQPCRSAPGGSVCSAWLLFLCPWGPAPACALPCLPVAVSWLSITSVSLCLMQRIEHFYPQDLLVRGTESSLTDSFPSSSTRCHQTCHFPFHWCLSILVSVSPLLLLPSRLVPSDATCLGPCKGLGPVLRPLPCQNIFCCSFCLTHLLLSQPCLKCHVTLLFSTFSFFILVKCISIKWTNSTPIYNIDFGAQRCFPRRPPCGPRS